jgi:hypothetical protein
MSFRNAAALVKPKAAAALGAGDHHGCHTAPGFDARDVVKHAAAQPGAVVLGLAGDLAETLDRVWRNRDCCDSTTNVNLNIVAHVGARGFTTRYLRGRL